MWSDFPLHSNLIIVILVYYLAHFNQFQIIIIGKISVIKNIYKLQIFEKSLKKKTT